MRTIKRIARKVTCKDGLQLSVQGSSFHYCSPRDDEGPYTRVEVGFIEMNGEQFAPPEQWREYADGDEFPTSVYGYVPVDLVHALIAEHGGMVSGELP